jgi:riboflavin synthase
MFTGIIEEVGSILRMDRSGLNTNLCIKASKVLEGTKIGDSIAVNGVCLTVTAMTDNSFNAFAMAETMRRTAFSSFKIGFKVNLERAMAMNDRFGGHIVSGHIDGTGVIKEYRKEGNSTWVEITAEAPIMRYVVEKGSIAIDGISLTVARVTKDSFSVSVIPHTGTETTLLQKRPGDKVNLENDIIAKYIEKLVVPYKNGEAIESNNKEEGLTLKKLMENGF